MWLRAWCVAGVATVAAVSLALAGVCSFSGASCTSDAECGIPGVCYDGSQGPVCHHKCATNADCTSGTFCYNAAGTGPICVGCGQDNSKCTSCEVCDTDDCKQFCHAECTATGQPCTISDPCIGGSGSTTTMPACNTTTAT